MTKNETLASLPDSEPLISEDGSLRCCNPKWNNCPTVHPRVDGPGFVIVGDDGQMVEFDVEQFERLIEGGAKLLARAGL